MAQLATEKEWQATVVDTAKLIGWWVYHTRDSRGSEPGYPDLVLVRPDDQGGRIVFVELKTDRPGSQLTGAQKGWIERLRECGPGGLRVAAQRLGDSQGASNHARSNTLRSALKPSAVVVPRYCFAMGLLQPP